MAPPVKSTKQATRGEKQIVEENIATLAWYKCMMLAAIGIYVTVMSVFFEFTTLTTILTVLTGAVNAGAYQFMCYMSRATYSENGQLVSSGGDLNMQGGIGEHVKDIIILTSAVQVLSLASNYFWLMWLLAPLQALWMLWKNILSPWFFQEAPQMTEKDEKKQKKMERKMARGGVAYKSH